MQKKIKNNLKLAIDDYEYELKKQRTQFEMFRRMYSEDRESISIEKIRHLGISMTINHELLIRAKSQLQNELSRKS
tara:strand:+ start:630 stop:857 length:228 start_codon:yes stop_codon:yes gene_type:complete